MSDYNASNISVLKGLEAVRQNPGMYVGDSDKKGLHHLVYEVVDNSIDEAMAGYCNQISIIIEDEETVSVEDNGRGIPVDLHATEKKSALEVVLTTLHAGGKFGTAGSGYEASGGLHGVGVSCVNALSENLIAEIHREGHLWSQEYSKGIPKHKVKKVRQLKKSEKQTGTKITWKADKTIFKNGIKLNENTILARLQEMAFLNNGLAISFKNNVTGRSESFKYNGGLTDYLKHLTSGKDCYPSEPIFGEDSLDLKERSGKCKVQIALNYAKNEDDEIILGFTNNINQPDGGTHITGFKSALTRAVNQVAKNNSLIKEGLNANDIREGLTAIVSIRFPRPEFVGQTKSKLGSTEAETVVTNITYNLLVGYFEKNAPILKEIVNRATIAAAARTAAKKQSDLIKKKGFLGKSNRMPGKLSDCNTNNVKISELYLVEGDSAAGSGKDGRDPEFQAILPIKGKIINSEKQNLNSILKNKEIVSLITAIGTGIKDDFDINKLRYDKIIIMSDADDDGCHIATLLLTFFYRFMRPLITGGHLYLAQPPLYCVETNKQKLYCHNDEELKKLLEKHPKSKIIRFKGLGEMDAEQLAETTMEPKTRRLIQLEISDAAESERIVSVLMGSDVSLRKQHISNQINSVIKI